MDSATVAPSGYATDGAPVIGFSGQTGVGYSRYLAAVPGAVAEIPPLSTGGPIDARRGRRRTASSPWIRQWRNPGFAGDQETPWSGPPGRSPGQGRDRTDKDQRLALCRESETPPCLVGRAADSCPASSSRSARRRARHPRRVAAAEPSRRARPGHRLLSARVAQRAQARRNSSTQLRYMIPTMSASA